MVNFLVVLTFLLAPSRSLRFAALCSSQLLQRLDGNPAPTPR